MANNSIVAEINVDNGVVKRLEETLRGEEIDISSLISGLEKAQKSVNVALTEIVEQDKLSQTLDEESADDDDDDTDSEPEEVSTLAKRKSKTDNGNCTKIKKT